jgi:hypothetical protein
MRRLTLYLRSRSVPAALVAALAATSGLSLLSKAISPDVHATLGLLAAAVVTAAIAPGLAGSDIDLDRTAAIAWPPRRVAHIVIAGVTAAGLLTVSGLIGRTAADAGSIARNVTGLVGLIALGACTLGPARAWLPSAACTLLGLLSAPPFGTPPTAPAAATILTWMIQPITTTAATVTAITLGAGGVLAHAILGPRR